MDKIPASERPWNALRNVGNLARDADLAKRGLQGFERDLAALSDKPDAERAGYRFAVANAEGRWRDVVTESRTAEAGFALDPKVGGFFRGLAWRELGQPDSAIAAFERARAEPNPFGYYQGFYQARILKTLGELYEAKGDTAKAVERYGEFTQLWKDADPALQPSVTDVRGRIARLSAAKG